MCTLQENNVSAVAYVYIDNESTNLGISSANCKAQDENAYENHSSKLLSNDETNDLYNKLKDLIISDKCEITLPSKKWGFHIDNDSIIFSFFEMTPAEEENKFIPTCLKKVYNLIAINKFCFISIS